MRPAMRSDAKIRIELVLERGVEPGRSLVALAAGAAAELVIDPARLVALRADDMEPAELAHALAKEDVHAAAGHVGREGHRTLLPRARDDERLALVVLRVQDIVLDAVTRELVG